MHYFDHLAVCLAHLRMEPHYELLHGPDMGTPFERATTSAHWRIHRLLWKRYVAIFDPSTRLGW